MYSAEIESLDGLFSRYVAGALPEPARVLVAAHLSIKPEKNHIVSAMEDLAGDALGELVPDQIDGRDARLAAVFAAPKLVETPLKRNETGVLPQELHDFIGFDLENIPWRTKMPGYREYSLGEIDGCEAKMLWIKAGRKMPAHTHEGSEITLVIDGAFSDSAGRYGRGDISLADDDVNHSPVAEEGRPCICFAVTDAPLRLTGSYRQFFSDFIGR
jgi:putative transcriptional regulator